MTVLTEKSPKIEAIRRLAFDAAPCPLLVVSPTGEVICANSAAEVLFGGAMSERRARAMGLNAPGSPLVAFVERTVRRGGSWRERDLELVMAGRAPLMVDAAASVASDGSVVVTLHPLVEGDEDAPAGALQTAANLGRTLAHEIKNPLAGIRGAAQLLQAGASLEDSALAQLIMDETDRVRRLVERLESFSDSRRLNLQPLNIHRILDRVRALVVNGVGEGLTFRASYDPSLPPVLGDEDQLVQVFLNLVKNAAEAARSRRDDRGEVVISTAFRHQARHADGDAPPTPLEVKVQDNGPGVSPDVRRRLFDPFVTGKPNGTGLGLTVAAQVVAAHAGLIDFQSEPGRTVFRVLLPVSNLANIDPADA
jgi:two-component system nitrogen regulation sensor histidine kinase GlnL